MAGIAFVKNNVTMYMWKGDTSATKDDLVGNLVSVGEFGSDSEEIDTTTLYSKAKEYVLGFDDYGNLPITQNVTDDEYTKMKTFAKSKDKVNFGIAIKNVEGEKVLGIKGECYVKSAKLGEISVGGILKCSTELRLTGEPTEDFEEPADV